MIPGLVSLFYKRGTSGSFSVTASPPSVGGNDTSGPVTSDATTATPSGGVAPYTYLWIYQSGSTSVHADTGTSATTSFTATLSRNDFVTAAFLCRVTDASSTISESNLVNISLHATGS